MSRPPYFNSREEWAAYAVQVAKSNGGMVQINRFAWKRGRTFATAVRHACALGLMRRAGGPNQRAIYTIAAKGEVRA